ncbi:PPR containing protein, putative [Medicago truncatula]|uniref:PPR containing protein, putative n=1 Tax=Medicago truncatula TaxID=3880 RepID=A0A072UE07_MEDTR|nr:PPR containing protein, putative [Medicago truncatula]
MSFDVISYLSTTSKNKIILLRNSISLLIPFHSWGGVLVDIARNNDNLAAFLPLFEENCRVAFDDKLDFMIPDVSACNAALQA